MTNIKYIYCQNCGAKNVYGNKFCIKCGHQLTYNYNNLHNFKGTTTDKPISIHRERLQNYTPLQQSLYKSYIFWIKDIIEPTWNGFSKTTKIIIIICVVLFLLWI